MKWKVIGISGATCSGKTTVAQKIHKNLKNSVIINQDTYFLPEDDPRHVLIPELNHFNWEILSSLDMSKMHSDIINIIGSTSSDKEENNSDKQTKVLIIEGFTIFSYKPITDLCQRKYFIDLSREVCWNRRSNRVYNPPDIPGYFDKIVWPEFVKYRSELISNDNMNETIEFFDGSKDISQLYDELMKKINEYLSLY